MKFPAVIGITYQCSSSGNRADRREIAHTQQRQNGREWATDTAALLSGNLKDGAEISVLERVYFAAGLALQALATWANAFARRSAVSLFVT